MFVNSRAVIEREGGAGTEVLVQVRDRPGAGGVLELPGGTLEEYEPLLDGLSREVREETGLEVTEVLDDAGRLVWTGVRPDGAPGAVFECLRPAFVYQTLRGPIDSIGFFFRCRATGTLAARGDPASGHRWLPVAELRRLLAAAPQTFNGLTQAALACYLSGRARRNTSGLASRRHASTPERGPECRRSITRRLLCVTSTVVVAGCGGPL